jgi:hypothetical protein
MPETFGISEEPETFKQRKEAAVGVLAELAKWCHCNHTREQFDSDEKNVDCGGVWSFNDEVEKAIRRGRVPDIGPNNFGDYDTYGWQVFCKTISQTVTLSKSEVEQRRKDAVKKLESGDGKPNASDGSKGQWVASLSSEIRAYDWLLGNESDEDE